MVDNDVAYLSFFIKLDIQLKIQSLPKKVIKNKLCLKSWKWWGEEKTLINSTLNAKLKYKY